MSITRSALRTKVQLRLGDTNNVYGSTLYNDIINAVTSTKSGEIAKYNPNYYLEQDIITGVDDATDSTDEFYLLPSDFRTFVSLERRLGGATDQGRAYEKLPLVNAEESDRYRLANQSLLMLSDTAINYEQVVSMWGSTIRIVPAPANNDYVYELKYLRKSTDASADETNLDIPDEWAELITLEVAFKVACTVGDPIAQSHIAPQIQMEWRNMRNEYNRRTLGYESMPCL